MWWLVLKILWTLVPAIIRFVREQQLRNAAHDEIVSTIRKRVENANKAEPVDESVDTHNRDNDPQ